MYLKSPHPLWQDRTIQLLGEESANTLRHSSVLVAGLGGVGAMAAEMICRAGVGRMTIVDADLIQPTNLNRQIPATHRNLGLRKATVMGDRLRDINPGLELQVADEFLKEEKVAGILEPGFDYVVDAIDTLSPKIHLIYHSQMQGMKLVSSMGSGGKTDPSQIRIADFGETTNCRLAFVLRKKLRKLGVHGGFKAVYSTEPVPEERIIPVEGESNKKSTAGTVSYIPAIFGCLLASVVIRELTGAEIGDE